MELMSSWEQGGALEEAAILKGRRKQEMRISSCSTYSSSASTMRNTRLKLQTEISRLMRSRSEMQNLLMPALLCQKEKDIHRQISTISVAEPEIKIYIQERQKRDLTMIFHHSPVPLSHALSVGGFYVIFHNLFPSSPGIMLLVSYYFTPTSATSHLPAQPATEETLNFLYFSNVRIFIVFALIFLANQMKI